MFFVKTRFLRRFASTFVVKQQQGAVFSIQINRPEVRNAVNHETAEQLRHAFRQFENDDGCRVAVLSGCFDTFCAGYDLKEVAKLGTNKEKQIFKEILMGEQGPMGPTRENFSKPVIAAISGHAVGGGLELALLCDLRVVEHDAKMGFLNRRFGVPLIDGGTVRLSKLIGLSRAMDLILTGRTVDSNEALTIGLANRVVSKGTAYSEAFELGKQIAAFPQACLTADRQSAYYAMFNAPSLDDALRFEKENSEDCLLEAINGATRFVAGAGRGGTFNDDH
ncbi:uncharacterized protein LOC114528562 [Dendronephthya gigantea]|uniref:uncharacterized protein LOC114528562 n=1 Tax=Dendronephthya gigantea TaxID=151771 RepID=UPI00106B6B03|nr:uncharacterized protein LOC114528562 [Dendronephthya gigantea]